MMYNALPLPLSSPFQPADWYQSFSITSLRVDVTLHFFLQMYTNTCIVDINYYLLHTGNINVAK